MTTPLRPKAKVVLVVSSEITTPKVISSALKRTPIKSFQKGTSTGVKTPANHPFNIAVFGSNLDVAADLAEQLEELVRFVKTRRTHLKRLASHCAAEIHISYQTPCDGGWTFEPSLVKQLAKCGLRIVVSVGNIQQSRPPRKRSKARDETE